MSDRELWVSGMKCAGCERAVETAISSVDGVERAKADHTTGRVLVTAASSVEEETLAEAIRAVGYGVD